MWETTLSVGKPRGQNAVSKQRSFGVHGQIERFVFFYCLPQQNNRRRTTHENHPFFQTDRRGVDRFIRDQRA